MGNNMICSDIWHKYHKWYFKIVIRNLRQFWNITSGIYAKYHVQIMLLFVYTTTHRRFVIFTCRYFKLSWNIIALSQSNCRNFSCSSIICRNFIGIYKINRTLHGCAGIRISSSRAESISHSFASLSWEMPSRCFQHSKIKFVSPRGHVISSISILVHIRLPVPLLWWSMNSPQAFSREIRRRLHNIAWLQISVKS